MSSKYVGIEDARKQLGPLVTAVQQGADVVLTRNGKPAARLTPMKESVMSVFTVEIQASNDAREIWQALAPAENIHTAAWGQGWTAKDVAVTTADHQDVAEGDNWRVCVWEGPDADTATEPAFIWESELFTLVELTRHLGLPDHEQQAVFSWTGETDPNKTWSKREVDELAEIWKADRSGGTD